MLPEATSVRTATATARMYSADIERSLSFIGFFLSEEDRRTFYDDPEDCEIDPGSSHRSGDGHENEAGRDICPDIPGEVADEFHVLLLEAAADDVMSPRDAATIAL